MTDDRPTYFTPDTLTKYFDAGTPTVQLLSSEPPCKLRIDPGAEMLQLFVPARGPEPDVTTLERLEIDTVELEGDEWFELRVDARDLHYEGYSLVASIVDDMAAGRSFVKATSDALVAYRELLNSRHGMTRERQEGLIGELLVLRHVMGVVGPAAALDSWLGPVAEQHDFGFTTFDAEVKTTTSETRSHRIGTTTQLQPSVARPLWLVSIQLTRAGTSGQGFSLASLVGDLRTALGSGGDRFMDYLRSVGWRDADHELYLTRYILRSTAAAYLVDDEFPAITPTRLESVVPQPELVGAVSYRVDISTLEAAAPPEPLTTFVQ